MRSEARVSAAAQAAARAHGKKRGNPVINPNRGFAFKNAQDRVWAAAPDRRLRLVHGRESHDRPWRRQPRAALHAPQSQTKILEGGTKDEMRIFEYFLRS